MNIKRDKFTIEQIAEAYEACSCNFSKTAKRLGVARGALWNWKNKEEGLQEALEDVEEALLDKLEETAFTRAFESSDKLLMFLLERRGRKRGYGKEEESINMDKITVKLGDVLTGEEVENTPIVLSAEEYWKFEQLKAQNKKPATIEELKALTNAVAQATAEEEEEEEEETNAQRSLQQQPAEKTNRGKHFFG